MTFSEQIKIILNREGKTVEQLALDLGTTKQNLYQQFKRNNFKENDMKKICDILGYEISINIDKIQYLCGFRGIIKLIKQNNSIYIKNSMLGGDALAI